MLCTNHSYAGEISSAQPNLLNRNFKAKKPNEKWLTDITEFKIPAGKIYLSPLIDCYDGVIVSCWNKARCRIIKEKIISHIKVLIKCDIIFPFRRLFFEGDLFFYFGSYRRVEENNCNQRKEIYCKSNELQFLFSIHSSSCLTIFYHF